MTGIWTDNFLICNVWLMHWWLDIYFSFSLSPIFIPKFVTYFQYDTIPMKPLSFPFSHMINYCQVKLLFYILADQVECEY